MKPRPIYRWKSFWLGVLVLVSLGWAWAGSIRCARGVAWSRGDLAVFALVWDGTVGIGKDDGMGRVLGFAHWNLADRPLLPEAAFPNVIRDPKSQRVQFQLPFALLHFLVAVLWSAWLIWHWRREQRKRTA